MDRLPDCYNLEKPNGPPNNGWGAASAVIDFTRDEQMFYREFLEVWDKVTTKGYDTSLNNNQNRSGLKPLQRNGHCHLQRLMF
jgi:hypothetical protein